MPRFARENGQATVEFALAVPVLCLLLFAIISFGTMIATQMDLQSASRDGARRAVSARDGANPTAEVVQSVNQSLDLAKTDQVATTVIGAWKQGSDITVQTSTPYTLSVMGITMWKGDLKAKSVVKIG